MAVFRVEKNKGYTVMSNHHLRNKALSLKAKGLLSQMLSLPEDWDYTLKGLSLINRESVDAIRTAVWELERAGYIRREQGRDAKGKMADMVYTIYEQPVLDKPVLENPTSDNPTSNNPASGNPTQLNKEIQRTNLPRKDKLNTDGQSTDSLPCPLRETRRRLHRRNGKEQERMRQYRFIGKSFWRISSMTISFRTIPLTGSSLTRSLT